MTTPQELHDTVAAGLALLTTEEADALIETPGLEHGILLQAMQAECAMLLALLVPRRIRKRGNRHDKMMAKAIVVFAQLLHFAYALGIRKGLGLG